MMDKQNPSKEELAEFEKKCERADLIELGHLLFESPTKHRSAIAEKIISRKLQERR